LLVIGELKKYGFFMIKIGLVYVGVLLSGFGSGQWAKADPLEVAVLDAKTRAGISDSREIAVAYNALVKDLYRLRFETWTLPNFLEDNLITLKIDLAVLVDLVLARNPNAEESLYPLFEMIMNTMENEMADPIRSRLAWELSQNEEFQELIATAQRRTPQPWIFRERRKAHLRRLDRAAVFTMASVVFTIVAAITLDKWVPELLVGQNFLQPEWIGATGTLGFLSGYVSASTGKYKIKTVPQLSVAVQRLKPGSAVTKMLCARFLKTKSLANLGF
jgi:hypothetical protein